MTEYKAPPDGAYWVHKRGWDQPYYGRVEGDTTRLLYGDQWWAYDTETLAADGATFEEANKEKIHGKP